MILRLSTDGYIRGICRLCRYHRSHSYSVQHVRSYKAYSVRLEVAGRQRNSLELPDHVAIHPSFSQASLTSHSCHDANKFPVIPQQPHLTNVVISPCSSYSATLGLCRPSISPVILLPLSQHIKQFCPTNCTLISRQLHTTLRTYDIERSKLEQTVTELKGDKDKTKTEDGVSRPTPVGVFRDTPKPVVVAEKKPLLQRIVAEIKHFYHGFRLLFLDVRICSRYIWKLLNGKSLTRRERRQFVRTAADLLRLVPFTVFVVVPFMEFLLPVALKLFPGMLPSTFKVKDKELEKSRKRLKMKLEMAKFLQDTIEDSAVKRKGAKGETVKEFVQFMEKIRTTGEIPTNEEILKYAKVFEDEITLDNLNYSQLRALCKLLEVSVVDMSETVLRLQIDFKLRQIEADDRLIMSEGIDTMAFWELQEACRARGMKSYGITETRLRSQLAQWLDLHLNEKIPTSLLLLSRTLFLPENLDTAGKIKATITELSESAAVEAGVKIGEVTGDRVDNVDKLKVTKEEEKIIRAERKETKKAEEQAMVEEAMKDQAVDLSDDPAAAPLTDPAKDLSEDVAAAAAEEKEKEVSAEDLEEIEEVLESLVEERIKLRKEQEDLQELKEDVTQHRERSTELKEIIQSKGEEYDETAAVQRLSGKVNRMIAEMDSFLKPLITEKQKLVESIEKKEAETRQEDVDDTSPSWQKLRKQIDERKQDLISRNEIIDAMQRLKMTPDEAKVQKITEVLDEDKDGIIGLSEALKVFERLGRENTKLAPKQVAEIVDLLRKEEKVMQDRKERKQREKLKETDKKSK